MGTYLITGATRGIGRAVVDELAGDDLILMARDSEALGMLCKSLPSARSVAVDFARPQAIGAAIGAAGLPDRLDGIVHSAALYRLGRLAEMTPADWTGQLNVNVVAVAELTRCTLPALRAARGTAVFVNSGADQRVAGADIGPYAASKHALVAVADALRIEEPEVRVTTVFPGRTATDMQRELRVHEGAEYRPATSCRPDASRGSSPTPCACRRTPRSRTSASCHVTKEPPKEADRRRTAGARARDRRIAPGQAASAAT